VAEIFVLFSFVMLGHYLGRTPLPYFYKPFCVEKRSINLFLGTIRFHPKYWQILAESELKRY